MSGYLDRLAARARSTGGSLCLGLDPEPTMLPPGFTPDVAGIEAFAKLVLEAAGPSAVAVKANLAFFEAFGADGIRALERIRAAVPPDLPFIADAKRGDIGTTSERQAVAIVEALGSDAVTLNPYLGPDAVAPFLARPATFLYLLCRTSNPAAAAVQDLVVDADVAERWPREPLHIRVARVVSGWASGERIGFVVGGTAPAELRAVRSVIPDRAFLIPGIGAQGGDLGSALESGPARSGTVSNRPGGGLAINVSRGVAGAWRRADGSTATDPGEAIRASAAEWATRTAVLL